MGRALVISPFIPSRFSSRASKLAYDTCHLMVELGYEQVLLHLPVEAHRQRRRQDVDVQELKACGVIGKLEMYADDLQTSQSEMGV